MIVHVKDKVEGAVYIGRWNSSHNLQRSKWYNPYKIGRDGTKEEVIAKYLQYLTEGAGRKLMKDLPELRGKTLACWCRHHSEKRTPANTCHGDVLQYLLGWYTDEELTNMY